MHLCGTFSESGNIVTLIQLNAVNSLFNICVSIFGYFGITRRIDKMFSLWCIVIFYSILGAAVPILLGNPPELTFLFKSLFPTVTGKYWYFTTYLILWLFSPYLNRISEALTQRHFKILLLLLVLVFYVFPTFFYFEIIKDNGKGSVNMLIIHDYSVISFLDGKWYLFFTVFGLSLVIFTVCSLFESLRKLVFSWPEKKLSVILQGLLRRIRTSLPL